MANASDDSARDTAASDQDSARQAMSKAQDAAKVVQREASKLMDDPHQYLHDVEGDVIAYVRQKPVQSLAIAAAFGFVIGALRR